MFAVAILNLVPRTRIELVMTGYQPIVIPFNYKGKIEFVSLRRIYRRFIQDLPAA